MTKNILRIILFVFLTARIFYPQLYSQQWVKTFNGNANGDDKVTNAVTDKQGNIYVTGYGTRTGSGKDFCTIKYNPAGEEQWTNYYNGPGNGEDRAFGIAVDNASNIYVTGFSTGPGSLADYTTIKYNTGGTELWVSRYNTVANNDDRAFGIAVDNAGYVYVTGYVTLANPDIYTIKLSPSGVYIWGQLISGTGNGEDKAFGIATDGINIYVNGYVKDSVSDFDIVTVKYDSSGGVIWSKIYNGPGNSDDRAFGIAADDSYRFIYAYGYSTGINSGTDLTIIRYNTATGDTSWVSRYNGPGNSSDRAFGIAVDHAENSYVTGSATGNGTGSDYITLKYDSTGLLKWATPYNNNSANSDDIAYDIVVPKQLNYVFVTGSSKSDTSSGSEDIVTIKYAIENGEQSQLNIYAGADSASDVGVKVVADTSENIFTAGYTFRNVSNYDWITTKFAQGNLIGINAISTEVPKEYSLYQNYPNPFNPSTKIKFDIKKSGVVKLIVYDILGRQAALPINEFLKTGTYEAELNFSNLSSGVYFYELSAQDFKEVKKMVLIK